MHDAKAPADDEGAPEQALDLLRRGVGGHVEVLRPKAQQQVAHGAAHDIGFEAAFLEGVDHVAGPLVDQGGIDAVFLGTDLLALAEAGPLARCRFAQQLVNEFLDHFFSSNRSSMRQPRAAAIALSFSSGLVATG